MSEFNKEQWDRDELQRSDEARLQDRASRAARTKVHGIIPFHFFSAASSECRELFIDGHFYGCISLAQAVAEGLSQFLGNRHSVGARKDPPKRVAKLVAAGIISRTTSEAFKRIWGNDRNTFHHITEDITTDQAELEARAEECVNSLYEIESEVFAFEAVTGGIVPTKPEYWPRSGPDQFLVSLRLSH